MLTGGLGAGRLGIMSLPGVLDAGTGGGARGFSKLPGYFSKHAVSGQDTPVKQ